MHASSHCHRSRSPPRLHGALSSVPQSTLPSCTRVLLEYACLCVRSTPIARRIWSVHVRISDKHDIANVHKSTTKSDCKSTIRTSKETPNQITPLALPRRARCKTAPFSVCKSVHCTRSGVHVYTCTRPLVLKNHKTIRCLPPTTYFLTIKQHTGYNQTMMKPPDSSSPKVLQYCTILQHKEHPTKCPTTNQRKQDYKVKIPQCS